MHEPPTPIKDADLLPWARRLVDYLRESRVHVGPGLRLRRSSSGTIITPAPSDGVPAPSPVPLHIIDRRPTYIPASPPPSGTARRYYIEWGTLNNLVADNWDAHHDIEATTYFFAKATLRTTDTLRVSSWEILTGPAIDTHTTGDWMVGDARPAHAVVVLGQVRVTNGQHVIVNSGGGSLNLSEHITVIQGGSSAGEVSFGKQLLFTRLHY